MSVCLDTEACRLPRSDSAGDIALCRDGDFVQHLDPLDIRLYTTCDMNRPAFPPKLTIVDPTIPIPAQISALTWVGSALGSWFGGAKVYTGAEMDAIREFVFHLILERDVDQQRGQSEVRIDHHRKIALCRERRPRS